MEPARTPAFERFLKTFEERAYELREGGPLGRGYHDFHTYALGALHALRGAELAQAEALLLERARTENDACSVEALGLLDTPAARAFVRQACAHGSGEARAAAAFALHDVDVATALLEDADLEARFRALETLAIVRGPAARPGLLKALGNDDTTMGWVAAKLLLRQSPPVTPLFERLLFSQQERVTEGPVEGRAAAVGEMVTLFGALRRRETAEGLGYVAPGSWIAPVVSDLRDTCRSPTDRGPYAADYDLGSLDAQSPEEVDQAVAQLLRLMTGPGYRLRDPRLPRALLRLGTTAAVEPLAAVLPESTGLFAVEAARALWRLGRRPEALERLRALGADADPAVSARAREVLEEDGG